MLNSTGGNLIHIKAPPMSKRGNGRKIELERENKALRRQVSRLSKEISKIPPDSEKKSADTNAYKNTQKEGKPCDKCGEPMDLVRYYKLGDLWCLYMCGMCRNRTKGFRPK